MHEVRAPDVVLKEYYFGVTEREKANMGTRSREERRENQNLNSVACETLP